MVFDTSVVDATTMTMIADGAAMTMMMTTTMTADANRIVVAIRPLMKPVNHRQLIFLHERKRTKHSIQIIFST